MATTGTPEAAKIPGEPTKTGTSLVETATGAIQGFAPINKIHQHLCGYHFYMHDMTRQVEAHHYCAHQNEEMRQCLIYDSQDADARLIGIEYIVSENLFMTLPDSEKPLWHSHEYEVKSGLLFMPGVPGPVQRQDLEKVAKTYGKTFHFWQIDKGDGLPLGVPQIMGAFTRDGQLYPEIAHGRYHFYMHDMTRQVEAHHYCAHQNEEMRQCLIYDSQDADARLIGIEYIVSENLFMTLPDSEKPLWHSHEYEVKSGLLFMPGVPGPVQRQDLEKVAKTYGKTFHFWQIDKGDGLPLGVPQIMGAFTRDGQLYPEIAHGLEKKYGVSMQKEREKREYIKGPEHGIHPLANGKGKGLKLELREVDCKQPVESVARVFV